MAGRNYSKSDKQQRQRLKCTALLSLCDSPLFRASGQFDLNHNQQHNMYRKHGRSRSQMGFKSGNLHILFSNNTTAKSSVLPVHTLASFARRGRRMRIQSRTRCRSPPRGKAALDTKIGPERHRSQCGIVPHRQVSFDGPKFR